ncbi:K02A2.6-like [Cordylochernes scorpioides]|uniref:K02A2.6-like n=1 Tax=Cordylochernes scorpioides TaxID=51811 RepID=A0ABY6LXZ1_9ARAC|nr:K02A2.6-like [Cordylochernes scorpioides]
MKKNYDKKHMGRSYEPGELVTVWTPIRKIGKCEKLLRKYFGPYRILKMSSVNYLIEPKYNPGQDPLIVHVSKIKPYYERMDESLNLFKMICLNPEKYRFEKKIIRVLWNLVSEDNIEFDVNSKSSARDILKKKPKHICTQTTVDMALEQY